jgi:endonuclease/exonuclease/phosphatase family metal-dependent hydrolase
VTGARVMTWNIQQGYATDGRYVIAEQGQFIKALAPDIVMLQEVSDASSKDSHGVEQTEALGQAAGLPYHSFWMLQEWKGFRWGIALLSRWEFTAIDRSPVERPWYTYLPWSLEGQRGILSATVAVDGHRWQVRCTHASHNGGQYLANHTRLLAEQSEQTSQELWAVLGGDFNVGQNDAVFDALHKSMAVVAGSGGEIDLIWVGTSATYKASGAENVLCNGLSDHNPVVVNLELAAATQPQPQPQPLRRLAVHFTPSPLTFPSHSPSPTPVRSTVAVTVTATDTATGAAKAGTIRIDASDVGGGTSTAPTGQTIGIPYESKVRVDPVSHEHELVITMARATVSAPGYHEQAVNWGV